jgi:hypothetical protein
VARPDLASPYDAYYYRTDGGVPYERSDHWLNFFRTTADGIVREIHPRTVLEVGCAIGLLVEALRERGVEAYGLDPSEYAIGQLPDDIKPYCWIGSVLDPPQRQYDLVVCCEVVEHLPPSDAERAVENLCEATDDVLFSSTPYVYREETRFNVQPPEYWAGVFAKQGFFRDVDFDPVALGHPGAVRFRRSTEPLHRIVASYERRFWLMSQENSALRLKALETKSLLAQQEQALEQSAISSPDVEALEQTIADQTEHIDALAARLTFMSDRERELRTMLLDAHEELFRRDESIAPLRQEEEARGRVIEELERAVRDRTEWAERMVAEAEARAKVIEELERAVRDRTEWAERMAAEAEPRAEVIEELERVVRERTEWAERMAAEAEARGKVIEELESGRRAAAEVKPSKLRQIGRWLTG